MTVECPVLAAGVGVRHGWSWVLRAASFRMAGSVTGGSAIGIVTMRQAAGSAVVDLLAGHARPAHGELRVLGEDLTTAVGRAAVRQQVGVARRSGWSQPGLRIRGLVEHAARLAKLPGGDRDVLTAAILDRLALTAWADVPIRSAPAAVRRRARLAAAAVHEPDLLLLDGMLDDLNPREAASVADGVRDLARDTAIVATGRDSRVLDLACDEVLTLADGVLVGI
ncbi:MAG TPA: ATP-binding cassette domain-containing protein [Streptosporangiaceae bacterium]|nr:ATP-binding cassette domain-containing protein [Streptosporangiaceae bacterium]